MAIIRGWRPPKMPSNKPKQLPRPRLSRNFGPRFEIMYQGGPLDMRHHLMHHPCGTLVFSLYGEVGHYNQAGRWIPIDTPTQEAA